MRNNFLARGYPVDLIADAESKADRVNREDLLKYKNKTADIYIYRDHCCLGFHPPCIWD